MKGEKVFFRKRFFGGFNREDVVRYISKIAEERNDAIAEKELAESNVQALAEELEKLRRERGEHVKSFVTIEQADGQIDEGADEDADGQIDEGADEDADEQTDEQNATAEEKEHPSTRIIIKIRRT